MSFTFYNILFIAFFVYSEIIFLFLPVVTRQGSFKLSCFFFLCNFIIFGLLPLPCFLDFISIYIYFVSVNIYFKLVPENDPTSISVKAQLSVNAASYDTAMGDSKASYYITLEVRDNGDPAKVYSMRLTVIVSCKYLRFSVIGLHAMSSRQWGYFSLPCL